GELAAGLGYLLLALDAQIAHPALEDPGMVAFAFGNHPDSAADAIRFAQFLPREECGLAVRLARPEAIEQRGYTLALRAIILAHGLEARARLPVAIAILESGHFALKGLLGDDSGAIRP